MSVAPTTVPLYLWWQDTDPKKAPSKKIEEGAERFEAKYGKRATVCLVHAEWAGVQVAGLKVVVREGVRPDTCWVGVA